MRRLIRFWIVTGCMVTIGASTLDAQILGRVSVRSATPDRITVLRGGPPVTITVSGSNLLTVDVARVLLDGRVLRDVHARLLSTRSTTERPVEISADAGLRSLDGLQLVLSSTQYRSGALVPVSIRVEAPSTPRDPDLVISRLDISLTSGGADLRTEIRVTNVGDGEMDLPPGTTVQVECVRSEYEGGFSPSNFYSANTEGPPKYETSFRGPLAPGASLDFAWAFPPPLSPTASAGVVCRVDGTSVVAESDESNNTGLAEYSPGG